MNADLKRAAEYLRESAKDRGGSPTIDALASRLEAMAAAPADTAVRDALDAKQVIANDATSGQRDATKYLVRSWLSHYWIKQLALDDLNKATGRSYDHGHLSRWERGERAPDLRARRAIRLL
jgi:hypothetical protein